MHLLFSTEDESSDKDILVSYKKAKLVFHTFIRTIDLKGWWIYKNIIYIFSHTDLFYLQMISLTISLLFLIFFFIEY